MSTEVKPEEIQELYGHNWARVPERREFVEKLEEIAAPEFEWSAEKAPAPEALSITDLPGYAEAIEEDFRVFNYEADAVEEVDEGFVVKGTLEAQGRLSREQFDKRFVHLWRANGHGVEMVENLR